MQNYKIKEENAENLGYTPPFPPPLPEVLFYLEPYVRFNLIIIIYRFSPGWKRSLRFHTYDNNMHEKITQFWLVEKGVQFFCNTSANYKWFLIGWKHKRKHQEQIRLELF